MGRGLHNWFEEPSPTTLEPVAKIWILGIEYKSFIVSDCCILIAVMVCSRSEKGTI